ncbi:MAG: SseB protein N-terminal domain [Thermoleophilia bacterium]|nr:SseB protein N-terminal domain [Thermoleophilia bacterium]
MVRTDADHPDDDDDSSGEWPEADADPSSDDAGDEDSSSEAGEFSLPTHVFFENESLIRALNDPRRGENDPELAKRLFSALLSATLIALVPEDQQLGDSEGSGEVTLDGELELSFVLVRHPDVEGDIVPMFTDEGSLGSFMPDGGRYVALAVRDLFPLLGSGHDGPPNIVINPGGDEALLLTPRMVQDLIDSARGYGTEVIDEGVEVIVGPADQELPQDAQTAVATLLAEHEAVTQCTQLQWFMPDRHDEPSLVLAVELDPDLEGDTRRFALASLWRDLSPVLRTLDRQVEMVDLAGQRDRLEPTVRSLVPFYVRPLDEDDSDE